MMLPDVDILVHAFRQDSAYHSTCKTFLETMVNGDARYGMALQVLSGMARVVTHPKVFVIPSGVVETLAFCDMLLSQPNCMIIQPGERHWDIFKRLCIEADAHGNLIPDAWLAAMAIESGCEWITLDRDFARFAGLRWRLP